MWWASSHSDAREDNHLVQKVIIILNASRVPTSPPEPSNAVALAISVGVLEALPMQKSVCCQGAIYPHING